MPSLYSAAGGCDPTSALRNASLAVPHSALVLVVDEDALAVRQLTITHAALVRCHGLDLIHRCANGLPRLNERMERRLVADASAVLANAEADFSFFACTPSLRIQRPPVESVPESP